MLWLVSMQTQCPHCQTLFHVTDEQLQAADGQVRCGECDKVFTAELIDTPEAPTLEEINDPELSVDELSINTLDEVQLDAVDISIPELEASDLEQNEAVSSDAVPNIEQESEQEDSEIRPYQPVLRLIDSDKPVDKNSDDELKPDLNQVQISSLPIDTSLQAANGNHEVTEIEPATEAEAEAETKTDSDDDGYDPSQLYPELETVPTLPQTMPIGYLAVGIMLILLFIAQSIYLLRDNLAEHGFRPQMQSLCASLNCELALPRAPNQITLARREIRSHPTIKNALHVKATINNQASFLQAYPLLQIQFHDVKGRIIAGRDFLPQEYLPNDINIKNGFAPNNPVNIALELIDPGKNAVSFLFIFK